MVVRAVLAACLAVCAAAAAAPSAFAGAVISNGTVALGVNDRGELNFNGSRYVGVTYEPTGNDGTRAGCACEGWGAGAKQGTTAFSGAANQSAHGSAGKNLDLVSFTSTATTARSVTSIDGKLQVTHAFRPAPTTRNLYEIQVTLKNLTSGTLNDLRYTRLMDWDVEPTAFREFVTIQRGTTPAPAGNLIYSNDNGFEDPDPFDTHSPLDASSVNANYTDKGPRDHGALFDFGFGALAAGQSRTFFLYYGATATESGANATVSAGALELYSYGQPSGGQTTGAPNTFIWGFKAVGGAPVIPPKLTLTPESATNRVGTSHTVTADVKDSAGRPVPGSRIAFVVTGANPRSGTATTGTDGKATFSWTGTAAGDDAVKACLDSNGNGACDGDEVTDTASKRWVEGEAPDTVSPFCALTGQGTDSAGRKYIEVKTEDDGSGLQSILVTKSVNATTPVPSFTAGTNDPVMVRGTKIDSSKTSTVMLQVTDRAGNQTVCDPELVRLRVGPKGKARMTLRGIPGQEHKVQAINGPKGVRHLAISVNGQRFAKRFSKGATRVFDLAPAMTPGPAGNTVKLVARGYPGRTVTVLIHD